MKFLKNKTVIIGIALLIAMAWFSGCAESDNISSETTSSQVSSSGIIPTQTYEYSAADLDDQYEENSIASTITLDDDNTEINGNGAEFAGDVLTINDGGIYLISGSLSDGQIEVDVSDTEDVHIILDGVNVTNTDAPAFYEKNADKVVLTLAEGSQNTFTDGADYADTGDDAPDAVVYSTHDLSINGSGELTANGNYNNGISSQDDLALVGGTLKVKAPNNGIKGRDLLAVKDAVITVTSDEDGLKSNNDSDTSKGFIQIDGGDINVTSDNDGIEAETNLIINGGNIDVTTVGTNTDGTESMKALKAESQVVIRNGTINIDSTDDAVHANGNITVDGGTFTIKTGDDAFHADYATVINEGTINIIDSYEGIEGQSVDINGGDITIVSYDDGINAAGGSTDEEEDTTDDSNDDSNDDTNDQQERRNDSFGGGGTMEYNEDNYIKVSGGKLVIISSSGDGLDSNGDLFIEGGNSDVSGPSSGPEGPLDANGEIYINGGEFTGSGVSRMAESPSDDSAQNSLMIISSTSLPADTTIYLTDDSGDVVAEHTPANDSQLIIFSSSNIASGETYSVSSGSPDNELFTVTISEVNTAVDESGQKTELSGMGRSGRDNN